MNKLQAIEMLGGSVTAAAEAIGITPSAVSQWPDDLPKRIEDRVVAAVHRRDSVAPTLLSAPAPEAEGVSP